MFNKRISSSVGVSEKWEAKEAGREVARNTLANLDNKPTFFLLFSTIHYENHGGLEAFLEGVWEILPEDTPLAGGTVAGFLTPYGSYVRGAAALAISYPNLDVTIGVGRNTKRSPRKAAKRCAEQITEQLQSSKYKNRFLISFISGAEILETPFVGRKSVIKSGILAKALPILLSFSQNILQKGLGREEEVLDELKSELPNYSIIHSSTIDDIKMLRNYQFYNNQILTNSIVALAFSTDMDFTLEFGHGGRPKKGFKITKTDKSGYRIVKINDEPAAKSFLELTNLSQDFFTDRLFTKNFPFFPLGVYSNHKMVPRSFIMVLKDDLMCKTKVQEGDDVFLLSMNGQNMIDVVDDILDDIVKPSFCFGSSCAIRLMALGKNIEECRQVLKDHLEEAPFLVVYGAGEATHIPEEGLNVLEESIALATFKDKKNNG